MPICANSDCRIEFSPSNRKQLYCSLRCRDKKHIRERREHREATRAFMIKECVNPDCCAKFETTDSRKTYCSRHCLFADEARRKRAARGASTTLLTKICDNPDCCAKFETYNETKIYCSKDCRIRHQNNKARDRRLAETNTATPCNRCGEKVKNDSSHCLRCQFELEADREYRKQQGGWNSLALKGFSLSDPYQRESFWLCWEGEHRPNFARGF